MELAIEDNTKKPFYKLKIVKNSPYSGWAELEHHVSNYIDILELLKEYISLLEYNIKYVSSEYVYPPGTNIEGEKEGKGSYLTIIRVRYEFRKIDIKFDNNKKDCSII